MKLGTTDELLMDLFSDLDRRPDFPVKDIRKKVALVSTPRCGSSMFCDILKRTEKVGDPREWINPRYVEAYGKYFGLNNIDLGQYLEFIFRKTASSNGIFVINFHVEQYKEVLELLKFDVFSLNFDKSYYLYRKEKIDQAYSLAKATITDQWSSRTNAAVEVQGGIGRARILQALIHISDSDEYYNKNMKSRIDREYFYEDFSSLDTTSAFTEVLTDLEITDFEPSWATSLEKQRSREDLSELTILKEYLIPSSTPASRLRRL